MVVEGLMITLGNVRVTGTVTVVDVARLGSDEARRSNDVAPALASPPTGIIECMMQPAVSAPFYHDC
jgi:hypothetical protein